MLLFKSEKDIEQKGILRLKLNTRKQMSLTYKPKKRKRKKTHGFLKRSKTSAGRKILKNKRRKKRKTLSV